MTPTTTPARRLLTALAAATLSAALTGCAGLGVGPAAPKSTVTAAIGSINGTVHGGQQPVAGSSIQLYTMNPTTLRGASTALLPAGAVTTAADGTFNVTVSYTCPTGDYLYIVATGGNAGAGVNNNLAMMAGLGLCGGTYKPLSINELTTVASAYALAPYMADYLHAGYNGTTVNGLTGIANAFAMIGSLVNIGTGATPGASAPANATMPNAQLNTVADIIATCVNTNTAGVACTELFGLATSGATQPTNSLDADINIANNPGAHATSLYNLVPGISPYQPTVSPTPTDLTLPIKLTGGSLAAPYGIAIDASGNAWVTNETGIAVSEFSSLGAALTGSGTAYTFSGAQGISIDPSGNIWIANTGGNTIEKLTSTGALSKTVTSPFLSAPVDVAADARGNIWVANFLLIPAAGASYISEFTNTGTFQNGLTGGGSVSAPVALAVDPSGNVWASNNGSSVLTEYSKTIVQVSPNAGITDNTLQGPEGIAFDANGNAWVAGQGGPELSGFTSAGASLSTTPIYNASGASLAQPTGIAVDGSGSIWITNSTTAGYLSKFTAGTGTPIANAQTLGTPLSSPVQLAIDPSGNLWTANSGDNSVTIFVGLAAPTITPLVAKTQ